MGKRKDRRRPTRREKIRGRSQEAESRIQKVEVVELPPLSEEALKLPFKVETMERIRRS